MCTAATGGRTGRCPVTSRTSAPPTALFVVNYPPDTGYAWRTIEQVLLEVMLELGREGWRALVCRPQAGTAGPDVFSRAGIRVADFDYAATKRHPGSLRAFCRLLAREQVRLLYLTDQPTRSARYPLFRASGVRRIVVHDRTSGDRTRRGALARRAKRLLHRVPGLAADRFIGVSDFVVRRLIEVNGTPPGRTVRVYNGIDLSRFDGRRTRLLQDCLHVPPETPIVFAAARAMPYKGISVLLRAARMLNDSHPDVHFAYAGDGPGLEGFRTEAAALGLERFHFLGGREDTSGLFASATAAVVPSVWAEAFGLTVVEAMAAGVAVVATRVGGIPELIEGSGSGLLVPPGDPGALATAIGKLLDDPGRRAEMGRRGREIASERFTHTRTVNELLAVLRGLGGA